MLSRRQIVLGINLASLLLCYSCVGYTLPTTTSPSTHSLTNLNSHNKSYFYLGLLYVQPFSDNLKYATFVSGTQPYYQSWHYQAIDPDYHPTFELGYNHAIPHTPYSTSISWIHLNSNDSDFKQASRNTALATVQFVAPPYEMSPPVFGIKRVDSKVNFDFDSVLLNVAKLVEFDSHLQAKFFWGLGLLKLNQTITTVFSDYAGSPPTPYSYPLPPDASFSFKTENVSEYLGAGTDLGAGVSYKLASGFGVFGDFLGLLTMGIIKTQDNFTATSARLTEVGIGTSHQKITAPNTGQVVFGVDSKLGVFYDYQRTNLPPMRIEAGYRMSAYLNAISTVRPNTLVQPGTVVSTPEFSTGTMAIVSTNVRTGPFNFSGPFLNIKIDIA